MKILSKILLLSGLFLTACTSTQENKFQRSYDEQILAAGIVGDKLVVLGKTYDYEFEGKDNISAFSTILSFEKNYHKRLSDRYPEIMLEKEHKNDNPSVSFIYRAVMPANKLSQKEQQQLLTVDKIRNETPFRIGRENNEPSDALYAWALLDGGRVISVSNRNELIQKLKFSQPFNIAKANQEVWITQTHQTNSGKVLEAVVTEPLSIIFLPIALIGQIPLLLLSVGN